MATPTEKILTEVLDTWVLKAHGIALQQVNTIWFMQLLREAGFEIVRATDLQKIRYQQKTLRNEINNFQKQATSMQIRVNALDKLDLVEEVPQEKEPPKEGPKQRKSAPKEES